MRKVDCNNCGAEIVLNITNRSYKSNGQFAYLLYVSGNWNYTCLACNEWGECLDWSDPYIARVLDATV